MPNRRYGELVPGYELPEFQLKIKNTSDSGIHDDATASGYGYKGGLVPGNTIYSYMSRGLVGYFGSAWLASGQLQVRFARPLYEGEDMTCKYVVTERVEEAAGERVISTLRRKTVEVNRARAVREASSWERARPRPRNCPS